MAELVAQGVNFVQTRRHEEGDAHAEAVARNIAEVDARNRRMEEERQEAARIAEEQRVVAAKAAEERAAAAKVAEERAAAARAAELRSKAGGAKGEEAGHKEDAMVISDDEGPDDLETEGEGEGGGSKTAPTKAASTRLGAEASAKGPPATKVSF